MSHTNSAQWKAVVVVSYLKQSELACQKLVRFVRTCVIVAVHKASMIEYYTDVNNKCSLKQSVTSMADNQICCCMHFTHSSRNLLSVSDQYLQLVWRSCYQHTACSVHTVPDRKAQQHDNWVSAVCPQNKADVLQVYARKSHVPCDASAAAVLQVLKT
jgi:hypothetical protein